MIKSIGKNSAFVSKSHLSTLLLKVLVQKTLKKSHKSLPFTIKTSLGQKQTLLILQAAHLVKNYLKTSFDKSSGFNKQAAYKMKKICSNQVLERTFSNHVFEIDVDSIEKLIYCSLQGGPFGGPACPPVQKWYNYCGIWDRTIMVNVAPPPDPWGRNI